MLNCILQDNKIVCVERIALMVQCQALVPFKQGISWLCFQEISWSMASLLFIWAWAINPQKNNGIDIYHCI